MKLRIWVWNLFGLRENVNREKPLPHSADFDVIAEFTWTSSMIDSTTKQMVRPKDDFVLHARVRDQYYFDLHGGRAEFRQLAEQIHKMIAMKEEEEKKEAESQSTTPLEMKKI